MVAGACACLWKMLPFKTYPKTVTMAEKMGDNCYHGGEDGGNWKTLFISLPITPQSSSRISPIYIATSVV